MPGAIPQQPEYGQHAVEHGQAGVSATPPKSIRALKQYTFVDYATQGYAALVAVLILLFHNGTVPHWPWLVAAHALILALIHGLVQFGSQEPLPDSALVPNAHQPRNPRWISGLVFLRHFYPVLLFIWFFAETGWLNRMFFREYLDPVVIGWDQALFGCQPSVLFMAKLPYLALSELFYASYFSYYLMIGGVGVALYLRNRRHFFHYVSVISFVFYVCYLIYILVPVIGPRVFFHQAAGYCLPEAWQHLAPTDSYPKNITAGPFYKLMAWIYEVFEAPGAAIPSSHVAVALGTVFFSFLYLRRIRYLHLMVALLLCLATVYCRYHYAVDVLTGIVTAVVLVPLGHWLYFKSQPRKSDNAYKPGR